MPATYAATETLTTATVRIEARPQLLARHAPYRRIGAAPAWPERGSVHAQIDHSWVSRVLVTPARERYASAHSGCSRWGGYVFTASRCLMLAEVPCGAGSGAGVRGGC